MTNTPLCLWSHENKSSSDIQSPDSLHCLLQSFSFVSLLNVLGMLLLLLLLLFCVSWFLLFVLEWDEFETGFWWIYKSFWGWVMSGLLYTLDIECNEPLVEMFSLNWNAEN